MLSEIKNAFCYFIILYCFPSNWKNWHSISIFFRVKFHVTGELEHICDGIEAQSPFKIFFRVYEASKKMPQLLKLEAAALSQQWPKKFSMKPPDGEDIELCFISSHQRYVYSNDSFFLYSWWFGWSTFNLYVCQFHWRSILHRMGFHVYNVLSECNDETFFLFVLSDGLRSWNLGIPKLINKEKAKEKKCSQYWITTLFP
jgi:hypothetical protein